MHTGGYTTVDEYISVRIKEMSENWEPIGIGVDINGQDHINKMFLGSFDGKGHTISGLKIVGNSDAKPYAGLFGKIGSDGTVKNLRLIDVDIIGKDNVGGLAGYITGKRTVENCYVTGKVEGQSNVGGLVGNLEGNGTDIIPTVKNSYAACTVKATGDNVGGLVGYVLATGDNWKDSLTGSVLAGTLRTPLLITPTNMNSPHAGKVLKFIQDNGAPNATVYLLGGEGVLGKDYETWAEKQGFTVKRLWGLDAGATAIKIAEEIKRLTKVNNVSNETYNEGDIRANHQANNQTYNEVFIVTDSAYADALSVASTAIERKAPILFVNSQRDNAEVVKALSSLNLKAIYVIGGEGAVPVKVYNALAANGGD